MNRREFLKSLAALGGTMALPFEVLASAPASKISASWKAANLAPMVFMVASYGTISIGDYEQPGSRAELYGIEAEWSTREELAEWIRCEWQFESIAENAFSSSVSVRNRYAETGDEVSLDGWEDWLAAADDDEVANLGDQIREWLDTKPDLGTEYDWLPPMNTLTPGSRAYSFFKCQDEELLDALGVVFVEGDHPGSSYFGAELHDDLAEVNARAIKRGIPIRFESED